jgi:hypothetical protein
MVLVQRAAREARPNKAVQAALVGEVPVCLQAEGTELKAPQAGRVFRLLREGLGLMEPAMEDMVVAEEGRSHLEVAAEDSPVEAVGV